MNELALFAGAGGGVLASQLLGHRIVCAVENDAYATGVLLQRQNDKILAPFPIWDDVRTFDGREWRGIINLVSGGFPCQSISSAGKGAGIQEGTRSGLWFEFSRIIGEVQAEWVWIENSPVIVRRGMGIVLSHLSEMGYDAEWGVLGSGDIGGPSVRKRMWILAHSNLYRLEENTHENKLRLPPDDKRYIRHLGSMGSAGVWSTPRPIGARPMGVGPVVASDVDRLRTIGNGQVPIVAAAAFKVLMSRFCAD